MLNLRATRLYTRSFDYSSYGCPYKLQALQKGFQVPFWLICGRLRLEMIMGAIWLFLQIQGVLFVGVLYIHICVYMNGMPILVLPTWHV